MRACLLIWCLYIATLARTDLQIAMHKFRCKWIPLQRKRRKLRKLAPIERKKSLGLLYLLTVLSMLFLLPTLFLTYLPSKLVDISLGRCTDFATIPAAFALGACQK